MPLIGLMRHGPAEHGGEEDPGLSSDGERLMQAVARGMRIAGLSFASIQSSPLRRALQTAALVAGEAGSPDGWSALTEAGPGARLDRVGERLAALRAPGPVLVVGHQPDMGRMAMEAIGARLPLPFGQGSLCVVEFAAWDDPAAGRPGQLRLFVGADLLAKIGEP